MLFHLEDETVEVVEFRVDEHGNMIKPDGNPLTYTTEIGVTMIYTVTAEVLGIEHGDTTAVITFLMRPCPVCQKDTTAFLPKVSGDYRVCCDHCQSTMIVTVNVDLGRAFLVARGA